MATCGPELPHRAAMSDNLYTALRAGFPAQLDAIAIETADTPAPLHYTWRDLDRGSAMLAQLLASLGLPPASRIAVQVDKSVEALMLYLGVLRAGHVHVPLNPAHPPAELGHCLANAAPAVVVCAPRHFGAVARLAFGAGVAQVYTLGDDRSGSLLARAAAFSGEQSPAPVQPDDLAAIVYTAGSTGRSKGAMLSHDNLLSNLRALAQAWDWAAPPPGGDVLIHALPLHHVHGLFVAAHLALAGGSPMLWFARFDAAAVVARLPAASVFMGVPTMYQRMLAEPALSPAQCARMRLFVSGSAPLRADTFEAWRARTGHTLLARYGLCETLMLSSQPYQPAAARRPGTVGRALPGVQLRICDDKDRPLPAGQAGHVQAKGPGVFRGYWRLPQRTADDFTGDLWFRTGDLGVLDAEGELTLVGRSKDVVISGGCNVYPAEVEGPLDELPGVVESAVFGVPHPDLGEGVVAVVVPAPGAQLDAAALIAALKERIAGYQVPKRIVVAAELPRDATGKVRKQSLREQHRALFEDEDAATA
jgi:malonyl-CoA/methylmalonyl-CoA synthetase